jgi:hypothetical protein
MARFLDFDGDDAVTAADLRAWLRGSAALRAALHRAGAPPDAAALADAEAGADRPAYANSAWKQWCAMLLGQPA